MNRTWPVLRRMAALWLGLLLTCALPVAGRADSVTVFAAASLKTALDEISSAYSEETGHDVTVSLAGSSALARQIEVGAPADVFISANPDWMDYLEKKGRIESASRFDLVGNRLVLITSEPDLAPVDISADLDLPGMLGGGRLAMALVRAVPAGLYGRSALEYLGLWESVQGLVVQADNVRAALQLVSFGEARLGIVYASDVIAGSQVRVLGTFPENSHPPIRYPAAAVTGGKTKLAHGFLSFLATETTRAILERQGFAVLAE